MENTKDKTGADKFKKPPRLEANQLRLNGESGEFQYTDILGKKEGEKAEESSVGKEIKVIFLKIRRKLSYYSKANESFVSTTEHNHKDDMVFLFGPNERGVASQLREKYQLLRTQQVVYCLYGEEVVRLAVKGASLGSEVRTEGVLKFYEYLQSFTEDEHVHEYETILKPIKEMSKMKKEYFAMSFVRGDKLPDEKITEVEAEIEKVHAITSAQDKHYNAQSEQNTVKTEVAVEAETTVEHTAEDIQAEDIPF